MDIAKEFDIMYYEYMIESVNANREINELLMGVNFAKLVNESCDELALYEANVFKTVINKIKEIFDRVIKFLKELFNKITKLKVCVPKDELVKQVENKIKKISAKDRDSFNIKNINISKACQSWLNEKNNDKNPSTYFAVNALIYKELDTVTDEFEKFMNGTGTSRPESDLKELLEDLNDTDGYIDQHSSLESLKKDAEDVSFNDIKVILSLYRSGESISNDLKKNLVTVTKNMEEKQKKFIKAEDKELNVSDINYYHNIIMKLTNLVVKLQKSRLSVSNILFHNQETILRKFVTYKAEDQVEPGTALAVR